MDYPEPDEDEFELMHAQEFEMLNEIEEDFEPPDIPPPKSKRSLDFEFCNGKTTSKLLASTSAEVLQNNDSACQVILPSCSTSSTTISDNYLSSESCNKLTAEDLFGEIDDLDFNEQMHKRPRLDLHLTADQKKEILIKKILEQRNKNTKDGKVDGKSASEFREKDIRNSVSRKVPKWPFMPLTDSHHQRFYFRLRTEDFMDSKAKETYYNGETFSLLDMSFEELKQRALNEVLNKAEKSKNSINNQNITHGGSGQELWAERYKPKTYCQLLSDESTNRSLLHWLKQWDKIVFNREPPGRREQNGRQEQRDSTKFANQSTNNHKWKNRNDFSDLIYQMDQQGRPHFKIAMLCGPPGLGKTTLAHTLARQAGYNIVEVNASDDRSIQAFRVQLEAATQMKSVLGEEPKPNCLILDEIDGAPQVSIDFLVKFAGDKNDSKGRKGNKKGVKGLLKRPIICICNDVYVPALRPLRQIAYTLNVPPTSSARLGERLMEITRNEYISTDLGTMMALSEKTNNDIRSCLSFLHCLKTGEKKVTLTQVHSANIGTKDTQQGLFAVWQTIFHHKISKNAIGSKRPGGNCDQGRNFSEKALFLRIDDVRRTVQSFGDYDRLAMGVFENYLRLRSVDSGMNSIVEAMQWFCYQDVISTSIQSTQIYSLYPYMVYPFVAWHLLFASINWPKLVYPHTNYEMNLRGKRISQVLQFTLFGMPAQLQACQDKLKLMMDIIPYLVELIIPSIRPVSIQLYTPKEKGEVERVTSAMADYNLSYTQERTQEGSYHYKLDPDIEEVGLFGEREKSRIFSYTGKQMISREVETEKLRRLSVKANTAAPLQCSEHKVLEAEAKTNKKANTVNDEKTSDVLPNHLQKLTPKALKKPADLKQKDFFGRVVAKTLEKETSKAKTDDIVKSDVWYHFKEGYNNAVRKNVLMSELY